MTGPSRAAPIRVVTGVLVSRILRDTDTDRFEVLSGQEIPRLDSGARCDLNRLVARVNRGESMDDGSQGADLTAHHRSQRRAALNSRAGE